MSDGQRVFETDEGAVILFSGFVAGKGPPSFRNHPSMDDRGDE
jgi:hypothetical protein